MQPSDRLKRAETELLAQISADRLMAFTAEVSREVRLSGSPEELRAFEYVQAQLQEWGWATRIIKHDGYVSWPGPASLTATGLGELACITHAMATPTEGLTAELVYVGAGTPAAYAGLNVAGKVVLVEGLAAPVKVKEAIAHGAVAQVYINDEHLHEMITSWVWGSPTLDELHAEMPSTPVVSVRRPDGARLKAALGAGPVSITVRAAVETRWRMLPILEAELPGAAEPDRFVLFSGHIDSWHLGAMDNGTANATMMEVARLLGGRRDLLQRGLRLCFWSGHSHGRYAGSAWYVDNNWAELRERCVAHVNIDSVGGMGATVLTESICMAESRELGRAVIHEQTGVAYEGARPTRSGDQSLLSLGVPSLFMSLSEQEPTPDSISPAAMTGSRSGGLGYWWHTTVDTIDKIDPAFLVRDCRIYLSTILRLCAAPVLPFNYQAAAEEYLGFLRQYQQKAGARFDLSPALNRAERLVEAASRFAEEAQRLRHRLAVEAPVAAWEIRRVNDQMIGLGRALIPSNYTTQGPFGQDRALPIAPIPVLAPIDRLATASSDEVLHLTVGLVRARNQVCAALDQALAVLE